VSESNAPGELRSHPVVEHIHTALNRIGLVRVAGPVARYTRSGAGHGFLEVVSGGVRFHCMMLRSAAVKVGELRKGEVVSVTGRLSYQPDTGRVTLHVGALTRVAPPAEDVPA
jgi:exonuclease VII large subunit